MPRFVITYVVYTYRLFCKYLHVYPFGQGLVRYLNIPKMHIINMNVNIVNTLTLLVIGIDRGSWP